MFTKLQTRVDMNLLQLSENLQKSTKIYKNHKKSTKIYKNLQKWWSNSAKKKTWLAKLKFAGHVSILAP